MSHLQRALSHTALLQGCLLVGVGQGQDTGQIIDTILDLTTFGSLSHVKLILADVILAH
jgi:hypothetical protein